LGRSLSKYVQAAEQVGLVDFVKDIEMVKYGSKIRRKLNKILADGKQNYLLGNL